MKTEKKRIFYTIKEVSAMLDIKQHTLRFWEKRIDSFEPVKHNSRRLYSEKDVACLKKVKHLLQNEQYKLAAIDKKLSPPSDTDSKQSPDHPRTKSEVIHSAINKLTKIKQKLEEAKNNITERGAAW